MLSHSVIAGAPHGGPHASLAVAVAPVTGDSPDCSHAGVTSDRATAGRRTNHRRHGAKGFTLVEMLLVVLILGVLVAMLVPQLADSTTPAVRSEVQADIVRLQSAMTDVYQETGSYAASTSGYVTSSVAPLNFRPSNTNITYMITTAVGGQGSTLVMKFATSAGTTTQCTLNLGTNATPGVVTCT